MWVGCGGGGCFDWVLASSDLWFSDNLDVVLFLFFVPLLFGTKKLFYLFIFEMDGTPWFILQSR